MWDRWQKGESLHQIARLFDRHHTSVRGILAATGGIRPPARRRSVRALTLAEREDVSQAACLAPTVSAALAGRREDRVRSGCAPLPCISMQRIGAEDQASLHFQVLAGSKRHARTDACSLLIVCRRGSAGLDIGLGLRAPKARVVHGLAAGSVRGSRVLREHLVVLAHEVLFLRNGFRNKKRHIVERRCARRLGEGVLVQHRNDP